MKESIQVIFFEAQLQREDLKPTVQLTPTPHPTLNKKYLLEHFEACGILTVTIATKKLQPRQSQTRPRSTLKF